MKITPNTGWAKKFWNDLVPLKNQIVNHKVITDLSSGRLPVENVRKALINFYPLVKNFRSYMALNAMKARPQNPSEIKAKKWLDENIQVEQLHADWWVLWGVGFGCREQDFKDVEPSPKVDAINHYLSDVNTYGSLTEGLGATNLAIEWPTGEWAKRVKRGLSRYAKNNLIQPKGSTTKWVEAHAIYDDEHPFEAMELIKLCARTQREQQKTFKATKRAMEYYLLALDAVLD